MSLKWAKHGKFCFVKFLNNKGRVSNFLIFVYNIHYLKHADPDRNLEQEIIDRS